jgi:two-component system phosphate regulon sensor histidine kinase PhoR
MSGAWIALLLRLASIALVAAFFGAFLGASAGLALVSAGLVGLLVVQAKHLSRLQHWLRRPGEREIPDAWGIWGDVFVALYRLMRREEKAREQIGAELELFRGAAQALTDGVVLLDGDGHILWCNPMAERHFAIDGQRDGGLLFTNLVRQPRFAEYIANGGEAPFMHRPAHTPGQVLSIEAIPFGGGQRKLVLSFDVTQIERADTMRRDFVANVSHEMRTPLTVIHGFLEHLTDDPPIEPAAARRQLQLIEEQSERMLRLVDDLLTLSRLESDDNPMREERVDVPQLLDSILADGRSLSGGRHSLTLSACPSWLKASREELRSAFGNLVSNAVRYTPEGGAIEIVWEIVDGNGVLRVRDTGIGIAAEHIPRLTERFYRVDRGRSRETGGTGLGLAILKHVLLRHQASLDIQSAPGSGSSFMAVFPPWRLIEHVPEPAHA